VPRDYRQDWDELARREPYFAVLTDPAYLGGQLDAEARQRFFDSGEADVERLLALIREHAGSDLTLTSALDFGCGVGRLTLPLARRIPAVHGCDVAEAMLAEARRNAEAAGITNAVFVSSLDALAGQRFDLICSLIVFQHIPVREGLEIYSKLLALLAPGGIAAVHFALGRPGGMLRRLARRVRAAFPALHRLLSRLTGDRLLLPYMQMNAYERQEVERLAARATGAKPQVVDRGEGEVAGAIFIARRPPARGV
jgi:SAM-dependent methyltransferase